ncbi:non-ribosomal peptide synthetase [Massilia sp. Root335]|uniref:non-ribosomal peptide synthetase n=1 Tax=Massilia sp. Root335 TaxID=1736517 RepID=UPI0009EB2150|nr:non-ribosomal peptide synthetase [Massilia sp. Root335]
MTAQHTGFPLSASQTAIFLDQAIHKTVPLYNIGGYVQLTEDVDIEAFTAAFERESALHDALQLRFGQIDGQLRQWVEPGKPVLQLLDVSAETAPADAALAWLDRTFQHVFRLDREALQVSALIKVGPRESWYCSVAHHLVIDGWGFGLWVKRLMASYLAGTRRGNATPPPAMTFMHSVAERLAKDGAAPQRREQALDALPDAVFEPLFEARTADTGTQRSVRVVRDIAPARLDALTGFACAHGFEFHHLLLALLFAYVSSLKLRTSLVVGLPSHNRRRAEKDIVGSYVRVIPCLLSAPADSTIVDLMGMARQAMLRSSRQAAGAQVAPGTGAGGQRAGRMFDIHFNYMRLDYETDSPHLQTVTRYLTNCWTQTPVSLNVCDFGAHQPTQLQLDVNEAFHDATDAARILDRLDDLARQFMASPELTLAAAALVPADEKRVLLAELGTATPGRQREDIARRFDAMCAAAPDAIALRGPDATLSYGQLRDRARQLAAWLQHDAGASGDAGAPLAIAMRASADAIVAMLAAVMLRRPYVPLDLACPPERLAAIVADADPAAILADADGSAALASLQCALIDLDDPRTRAAVAQADGASFRPAPPVPPAALNTMPAWIIYTSGSTGTPKGVVLPQAAILRLVLEPNFMVLDAATVMLQAANLAFDAATLEIWGALLNGGTLVLHGQRPLDLDTLTRLIDAHGVTHLWLTAGLAHKWVARLTHVPSSLKYLLSGGDVVPPAAHFKMRQLAPDVVFINGYGPTENGVFTACAALTGPGDPVRALPIGRPVNGTTVHVVDAHGRLLPIGEAGELWTGGDGLAIGYLNQPALTAEKFADVPGPDIGERVYKTGDRVRWRPDGQLEYLGRIDQQVKIRGFRVEPGDIESCLCSHPEVAQAAVVAAGDGAADKYLRAFVRCHGAAADTLPARLAAHLRCVLPDYMVPAHITVLDQIPINANGKIDRARLRALPPPPAPAAPVQADASATERAVWTLWQAALQVPVASVDADFYALGGHSLAAMQLQAELNDHFGTDVALADILRLPTIRQQADLVDRCLAQTETPAPRRAGAARGTGAEVAMSFVQQQMWLSHKLNGGSHEYNVPGAYLVRGALDCAALQEALRRIVGRHLPLACVVVDQGERAVLRPVSPTAFVLAVRAVPALDDAARTALARDERLRSFDLERDLPLRASLFTCDGQPDLLLVTFHHIAVDGLSLANFQAELAALYREVRGGARADLPELAVSYEDFALDQCDHAGAGAVAAAVSHWQAHLHGAPAVHELPLDKPRPEKMSFRGRVARGRLDPAASARLAQLAARERVSLFTVMQTAFAVLVGEYSQCRDVLVGTPVSGRPHKRLYPHIGCFINTVVTRTAYAPPETLHAILARNAGQWQDHLAHHQVPFAQVLGALAPVQSRSVNPLFQLWFVLHGAEPGELHLDDAVLELQHGGEANTKFDLMLAAMPGAQGMLLEWQYADDLFEAASMERMLAAYVDLLRGLPDLLHVPVRELAGRLALAGTVPAAALRTPVASGASVAHRVLAHAAVHPSAPAVSDGRTTLDYHQLAGKVRRLAAVLGESGVEAGQCVALCADRTIGGVVAMLAIQALGAAYVPIDPKLPAARLEFVLDDAGARVLVCHAQVSSRFAGAGTDIVLLDGVTDDDWLADYADAAPPAAPAGDHVAYLIYTSGSSGYPKGVRVTHANLAHYVTAMTERHGFGDCRRYAVSSAFHTDLGNTTLYLGLWHGACLYLMDNATMLDGAAVSRYVHEHAIEVMKITPGHFTALCDEGEYAAPVPSRFLVFGGEVLRRETLDAIKAACLRRGCAVINHYGPTETTIGCLTHAIDLHAIDHAAPLGLPLPGVSAQVLKDGLAVPRGAWGELVIGGPTVSLGYQNREDLNSAAFFRAPGAAGAPVRHYRTGDRVRLNARGLFEFGGRFDDQVKIRGFRIELAEIDSSLLRLSGVSHAITLVHRDDAGQDCLASFVVARGLAPADAMAALRGALPDYMLPKAIVVLASMPLLGNGKPDRRALLAQLAGQQASPCVPPATPTEIVVHRIMCALLKTEQLSVDQRFFDAGGNSLLVTRLANELDQQLQRRIPVHFLMENHSPRTLADLIDALAMATSSQQAGEDAIEIEI